MANKFEVSRAIRATPAAIWSVLTRTSDWPSWDPFCDKIEGELALGSTIKAFSKLAPGRAFPVKVTELVQGRSMTWTGGMPLGLFKGVRTFALEPGDDATTRFTMREEFSGPMRILIGRMLPDMTEAFNAFADGLKAQAEALS